MPVVIGIDYQNWSELVVIGRGQFNHSLSHSNLLTIQSLN